MKKILIFIGVCFTLALAQSNLMCPSCAGTGTRLGMWSPPGKALALANGTGNYILAMNTAGTLPAWKPLTVDTSGNLSTPGSITSTFSASSADALLLTSTTAGNGITIGGDVNLYRSAANILKTDDALNASGLITASSGIFINGITGADGAAGHIAKRADAGLLLRAITGSASDFEIWSAGGSQALAMPTGTNNFRMYGTLTVDGLTASLPVFTDGSKRLVSNPMTGTGNVMMSASPTTTGSLLGDGARFQTAVSIGTSTSPPTSRLFVTGGFDETMGIRIQDNETDNTVKQAHIKAGHYTNSEEPFAIALTYTNATISEIYFGGGTSLYNAATGIRFLTAANNTTVTGTDRGGFNNSGVFDITGDFKMNAAMLLSSTAPTISSGFGTSPSIASNNGTAAFTVNVGTGGTASSGVIGLPTATTGWNCFCNDITTFSATVFLCRQTASSTTSATIGQFTPAAVAQAWVASDIVRVSCFAY